MLTVSNASLCFEHKEVFSDLSLTLPSGSWTSILGKTGCGKSSLLKLLTGIIPKSHRAFFQTEQKNLHLDIAYMAQSDGLMPWLNVQKNIFLGHTLASRLISPAEQERALGLLEQVGLMDYQHAYPKDLSGGMRQRVALVRTLMQDRNIVFMDEPFSALDAITRHEMQELAFACLQEKTVLMITHDPFEALRLSHQVLVMTPDKELTPVKLPNTEPLRDLQDAALLDVQQVLFSLLRKKTNDAT